MTRTPLSLAGLTVSLTLVACGGSSDPDPVPTPAPTPAPCTQSTAFQGTGPVSARAAYYQPFSMATGGRLDVTVDWTFTTSPVGVYVVAQGSCELAQLNARTCNFVIRSETAGAKPRKISVTGVAAGAYDLILGNAAEVDESMSVQVVVSSVTCPALAGTVTGTRAHPSESMATFTRQIRP